MILFILRAKRLLYTLRQVRFYCAPVFYGFLIKSVITVFSKVCLRFIIAAAFGKKSKKGESKKTVDYFYIRRNRFYDRIRRKRDALFFDS